MGKVDATTCTVQFADPWGSGPVQTQVDCPRTLAASFDVLAFPPPLRGDAMNAAGAGGGLAVALTLLLVPAVAGVALRTRQSRRAQRDQSSGS